MSKMKVDYAVEDLLVMFKVVDEDDNDAVQASFSFDFDAVHTSLKDRVSLYGLNKLLTDRTSGEKDKLAKLDAMEGYFDMLIAGEWAKERVVGAPVVGVEVEALAEIKDITVPQAQAALAQYDKETRAKILGGDDVQAKAKEIRETRADAEVISLDDMI
jgi:hypothetical protein